MVGIVFQSFGSSPCTVVARYSVILDYLTADEPIDEILRQYPSLTREHIRAAVAYAAWLAHEEEQYPLHTETSR